MSTIQSIKKVRCTISFIVILKYITWCLFLIYQAKAIEIAIAGIENVNIIKHVLYTFVFFKIIAMLSDIVEKFVITFLKNKELKLKWRTLFPLTIYKDNEVNYQQINVLFYDYLPKLFDLEVKAITNKISCIIIAVAVLIFLISTNFFYGIISVASIFILNYMSKNIFIAKIEKNERLVEAIKLKIIKWIDQYFHSYREISKSWNNTCFSSWKNQMYDDYFHAKNREAKLYLYKDMVSQLLLEIPFTVNTTLIIFAVYYQYVSIAQMFIWIGMSQFVIDASNAYLNNKMNYANKIGLVRAIHMITDDFKPIIRKHNLFLVKSINESKVKVTFNDGTKNYLGLKPMIYTIQGANGCGKSTLLDIILGYERKLEIKEHDQLVDLMHYLKISEMRCIERNPIIFDNLDDFTSQLYGPNQASNNIVWFNFMSKIMEQLFGSQLSARWLEIFKDLELKYYNNNKLLSTGEKIILSFMRTIASWNDNIVLLVIDECDAFLDSKNQELFDLSLEAISKNTAVYMVKHNSNIFSSLKNIS